MKTEKSLAMAAFLIGMLICITAEAAEPLALDKSAYAPNEKITITFNASASWSNNAWIGIIPGIVAHGSEIENDKHDLVYEYLEKRETGTITFTAPGWPGSYDVRMHDSDDAGKEVASVTFTVTGDPGNVSLKLAKDSFKPGETITLEYVGSPLFDPSAWIGIIPSNVDHGLETTNDNNDLTYQRAGKGPGTLTFTAPSTPGSYDFRMNSSDDGGLEVASVSFTVAGDPDVAGKGTLSLPKDTYAPGEQITVTFTADTSWDSNAWIGLIPSSVPHGDESVNDQHDLAYEYLEKRAAGTLTFTAPDAPGSYDLRMNSSDSNGIEVTSVTFTVK